MSWKTKLILIGSGILLVFILLFIVKMQYDMIQSQKMMELKVVEMKELHDKTMRSQGKYATRDDVEKIIKENGVDLSSLKKDLGLLDAKIVGVITTSANSKGFTGKNLASTSVTPNTDEEKVKTILECGNEKLECPNSEYLNNRQVLALSENFGQTAVPLGEVGFSAWQKEPWDLSIKSRKYTSTTVLSTNDDGRHFAHNKLIVEVDGKQYTIPITNSQLREVFPDKKFRFTPRIYMGLDGGLVMAPDPQGDVVPNAQLSLFSYGKTKLDNDWTFLGVGVGYETQQESINLMVSPINYNVGKPIPLIDNMHVGPSISYDFEGNLGMFLGVRVGL